MHRNEGQCYPVNAGVHPLGHHLPHLIRLSAPSMSRQLQVRVGRRTHLARKREADLGVRLPEHLEAPWHRVSTWGAARLLVHGAVGCGLRAQGRTQAACRYKRVKRTPRQGAESTGKQTGSNSEPGGQSIMLLRQGRGSTRRKISSSSYVSTFLFSTATHTPGAQTHQHQHPQPVSPPFSVRPP